MRGKRVTIFVGESDQWHHRPLYLAILEHLKAAGCSGATVTRGTAGFGAHSQIKTATILRLSVDLPVIIAGSFILGLIMGILEGNVLSPAVRLAMAIGFVGAYTTFSTWTYETIRLIENGSLLPATMNIAGSVLVGLLAVMGGLATGRML